MRDWKKEILRRMCEIDLPPKISEEVVCELASHLEEIYEEARSRGLSDAAALEQTLQEVEDWHVLAREISCVKEDRMNCRTKGLWLPALITLLGTSAALALSQYPRMGPRLVWIGGWAITLYWTWLATLPAFGALGAYLSRRAETTAKVRLVASLSPALVMLIVMCIILPFGLAIDGFHFFRLVGFGLGLINWVAIPGLALLAGAAPFLGTTLPRQKLAA
jgi:hypothetical protein